MPSNELPPQDEEGNVQDDDHRADGSPGEDGIDDLAHAGDAAETDVVGRVAPVEAERIDDGGQGDPDIGQKGFSRRLFHSSTSKENQDSSIRDICSSPRSSSLSRAPATGRERAR